MLQCLGYYLFIYYGNLLNNFLKYEIAYYKLLPELAWINLFICIYLFILFVCIHLLLKGYRNKMIFYFGGLNSQKKYSSVSRFLLCNQYPLLKHAFVSMHWLALFWINDILFKRWNDSEKYRNNKATALVISFFSWNQ